MRRRGMGFIACSEGLSMRLLDCAGAGSFRNLYKRCL